jgi:hypothetical protein
MVLAVPPPELYSRNFCDAAAAIGTTYCNVLPRPASTVMPFVSSTSEDESTRTDLIEIGVM